MAKRDAAVTVATPTPASALVWRPALVDRLENAATGPVTVVSAPAGSGKTVLVRSWLESRGAAAHAAWVSVERGERDAQRFWDQLFAKVRAATSAGARPEARAPSPNFDADAAVDSLLTALAALEDRLVLVIDDVHEIADRDILAQLTRFLDQLPSALHVVLISRRDPQLGLHRRRLQGGLAEIRSEQLRFTLEEARQMLGALGIELSDDGLRLLHERTEGWVAGLRLAALSLAAHSDPERFVVDFSGSDRTVAEYLLAEVLDSQPAEIRRLLVRASLLERFNGALGDLLTGGFGSERHLRELADAGSFVVALDPERTWFRFHHLFGDLLAVELRHSEAQEVPRLHRAAAQWYADHGYAIEAIEHAQAAGDQELVAELLIGRYFSLTLDGRQATAHALVEAYAYDPLVSTSAEIATIVAADQLYGGSLEHAATQLALAQQQAGGVPEYRRHRFEMALVVTRLTLARRLGDFRSVLDEARPSDIAVQPMSSVDVSMYNDVRALMLMNLGIVEVWSGRLDDGSQHLAQARQIAAQIPRPYLVVACDAHLAHALSWRSFTAAREASKAAIALAVEHGWGTDQVIGPARVTLATALVCAGRLDEAELELARAEATLRVELEPAVGCLLQLARGIVDYARGRYAAAIDGFRAAEQLAERLVTGTPLALQIRCVTLYAMLASGQLEAVRASIAGLPDHECDTAEVREVRAALALADGDPDAAVAILAPVIAGERRSDTAVITVRAHLLEALARDALGQPRAAEEAIERALGLAEEDALILPFMYMTSHELLERHPRFRTAHGAFLAEVLDVVAGRPRAPEREPPVAHADALSDAELRVLRYLPTNLPAAGIASEIYVSTNTVKTHMRHIYGKLGAHSRREAVERARELGLLGHSARHD
jgi:LuxR family maltose regulon positive regulatory protein